jgi:hypothetical protein
MTATIYSHKTIIGTTDLQIGDEGMGCVFGQFIPNESYYRDIQKYVWDFWATNKPDYEKWYSLRFNAQLDNGFFLFPCGGYTFDDIPDLPDEPKRIDMTGIDISLLSFSKDALLEPWETIDIGQKISLEDELRNEVTSVKTFFGFLSSNKNDTHILSDVEFSTFANYGPNDDVLFAINKKNDNNTFATVHLTWKSREREHSNYFPATHFYLDYNDFVERRMIPDNKDWNE